MSRFENFWDRCCVLLQFYFCHTANYFFDWNYLSPGVYMAHQNWISDNFDKFPFFFPFFFIASSCKKRWRKTDAKWIVRPMLYLRYFGQVRTFLNFWHLKKGKPVEIISFHCFGMKQYFHFSLSHMFTNHIFPR